YEPTTSASGRVWSIPDGTNAVSATPIDAGGFSAFMPIAGMGADPRGTLPASRGTFWLVRFTRPVTSAISLESSAGVPDFPVMEEAKFDAVSIPRLMPLRAEAGTSRIELVPGLADR